VALAAPTAQESGPVLTYQIKRSGNRSVFGDLIATFTPRGGQPLELAKAGGVAVYVPNPVRRVRMNLTVPPGVALSKGTLNLTFRERAHAGGKLIAESSLPLP
jgi:hypothetical protein